MKFFLIFLLLFSQITHADQAYLERFLTYQKWSQNLPLTPDADFLTFIQQPKPLSRKLREKWLYTLALRNDWQTYLNTYQASNDLSLQCYYQYARYQQGQDSQAIIQAKKLWLTGYSRPPACDKLFTLLFHEHQMDDSLITARAKLALSERNYGLANYLIKKVDVEKNTAQALEKIQQKPQHIHQLKKGYLYQELYLYGLKKLLVRNVDKADQIWSYAKRALNADNQQEILKQIAYYKSLKNKPDAAFWLSKIDQHKMDELTTEWQIRYALKNRQWSKVLTLIEQLAHSDTPCWQYWKARALEAQKQPELAKPIYQSLAKERNYYGFLASNRLHQPFQLNHEKTNMNLQILSAYTPIMNQIQTLYQGNQQSSASSLVNDFISELPKDEKSAFVYWLFSKLHWIHKAINLSNDDDLFNQLSLRFPIAYQQDIQAQSKRYQVPEALIYAVIRQESAFNHTAVSYAGAHGLMQLMPGTATWISKMHHIGFSQKQQLFSFSKNIHIGVAYLHHLLTHYHQSMLLTVAAYNAGPTQVKRWLTTQPLTEPDIWIETIPYTETRNYLKSVMSYYVIYQAALHQPQSLKGFL